MYGNRFDFPKLKAELSVLYASQEVSDLPIFQHLTYLRTSGLNSAMPEVSKLATLMLTIPVTSASAEATFSGMERIQTYLRGTQTKIEERLSGLALISIE